MFMLLQLLVTVSHFCCFYCWYLHTGTFKKHPYLFRLVGFDRTVRNCSVYNADTSSRLRCMCHPVHRFHPLMLRDKLMPNQTEWRDSLTKLVLFCSLLSLLQFMHLERVVARAVSYRLLTAKARDLSQGSACEFCCGQCVVGAGFSLSQ